MEIFREKSLWTKDIEGDLVLKVKDTLTDDKLLELINSEGFLANKPYDSFLIKHNPVTKFRTIYFFDNGVHQFSVAFGQEPNSGNVGAITTDAPNEITDLEFVQGENFRGEPIGSVMGIFYAIGGGQNVTFSLIQDLSGYFEIINNELVSKAVVFDGAYNIVIKATSNSGELVKAFTVVISDNALITNINISNLSISETSPIGKIVSQLSTVGGQLPIIYTILSQTENGNPVDIFEIDDDLVKLKNTVGVDGTEYKVLFQATDNRATLPDEDRKFEAEYTFVVTQDTFSNVYSFLFNGVDERLSVPYNATLFPDSFSISLWFKCSGFGNGSFAGVGSNYWYFDTFSNGQTVFRILDSTGNIKEYRITDQLQNGNWHFITASYNSSTDNLEIFADGAVPNISKVSDDAFIGGYRKPTSIGLGIGNKQELNLDQSFDGQIDEVTFHSKALDVLEHSELYNSGSPINPTQTSTGASIVSWWRMGDNIAGSKSIDVIGANDADLINMNNGNRTTDIP